MSIANGALFFHKSYKELRNSWFAKGISLVDVKHRFRTSNKDDPKIIFVNEIWFDIINICVYYGEILLS